MTEPSFIIDILRHGACQGGEIYRGSTDVALSPIGKQQMFAATAKQHDWQAIISSPLQRCAVFAQQLSHQNHIPLLIDKRLREIDFGLWEGRLASEVWQQDELRANAYNRDPINNSPPQGEATRAVLLRVKSFWSELLDRQLLNQTPPAQRFLLVSHAGVIRLLLCDLLEMPISALFRLKISYACISRIEVYTEGDQHYAMLTGLSGTPDVN